MVDLDGVELCVQTFGDAADPTLLLIAGMSSSMDNWLPGLCENLAGGGRFVVRYDHRDTGRSQHCPAGAPDYTFADLTADALGVLDALGRSSAHLVGISMGGGIAQYLAAHHSDRVRSLTLVATSPGGERTSQEPLPPPVPALMATFEHPPPQPDWTDRAASTAYLVGVFEAYAGSLDRGTGRHDALATVILDRTHDVAAADRNHPLAEAGVSLPFRMADLAVPTLVVHGSQDPLFPLPHGEALAAEISGARLLVVDGMGHEVPPESTWPTVVPAVLEHTADEPR